MKYRNLVEAGLQREDGGGVLLGGTSGAGMETEMESGRVGEGEEDAEMGSFDEWDRELMGGDEDGVEEDESGEEEAGTMSKISRETTQRQRQRRSAELPRYHDGLEGEYDEDDEDFMDGELVGGDGEDLSD